MDYIDQYDNCMKKLYNLRDEFFYKFSYSDSIFKRLRGRKLSARTFVKQREKMTSPIKKRVFVEDVKKTIEIIDELLQNKLLYESNIQPLNEIKDELDSMLVMVELTFYTE